MIDMWWGIAFCSLRPPTGIGYRPAASNLIVTRLNCSTQFYDVFTTTHENINAKRAYAASFALPYSQKMVFHRIPPVVVVAGTKT
jgi:hypothetical protein